MPIKIGILNCYSDESKSAPSANYFSDVIDDSIIINICHNERIENIHNFDGYIISGSRSYHRDQDDWIAELQKLIKIINKQKIPCLAVCFGHQVVAQIFGGTTVRNFSGEEGFQEVPTVVGDTPIKLFSGLPNPIRVYQSHYDSVMKAPPDSIQIIYNEKCIQYYQFGSIYSIQSHPEINVSIAKRFAKRDKKEILTILNGIEEQNIQSHRILKNFISIIKETI